MSSKRKSLCSRRRQRLVISCPFPVRTSFAAMMLAGSHSSTNTTTQGSKLSRSSGKYVRPNLKRDRLCGDGAGKQPRDLGRIDAGECLLPFPHFSIRGTLRARFQKSDCGVERGGGAEADPHIGKA